MRKIIQVLASTLENTISILLLSFIIGMILNWNFLSSYVLIILIGVLVVSLYQILMNIGTKIDRKKIGLTVCIIAFSLFISVLTKVISNDATLEILEFQRTFPNNEWTIMCNAFPFGLKEVAVNYLVSLTLNKNINTDMEAIKYSGNMFVKEYTDAIYEYKYDLGYTLNEIGHGGELFLILILVVFVIGGVCAVIENSNIGD